MIEGREFDVQALGDGDVNGVRRAQGQVEAAKKSLGLAQIGGVALHPLRRDLQPLAKRLKRLLRFDAEFSRV